MPVEFHAATPIEVYTFTAWDLARFIAAWFATSLLAAGFTAWVFWPERDTTDPAPVTADPVEVAKTVELPNRPAGLRAAPTIHAPQYRRAGGCDDTVVIDRAGTRS